jgi:serine/threonine-protein kinase RsbW
MREVPTLRLKATLEEVPLALDFVTQSAKAAGFDEQALYQIQVAVDEACANVVEHAYRDVDPGDMEISCCLDEQTFVIRVRDWGASFDPDEVEDPDVDAPLEERSLGGLGVFLIKQFMEQVQFSFDAERGNELVMTKRLQAAD